MVKALKDAAAGVIQAYPVLCSASFRKGVVQAAADLGVVCIRVAPTSAAVMQPGPAGVYWTDHL